MKTLLAAVLMWGGLALVMHGQVVAKETPELKALQARYKADMKAAARPIQERYLAQYEALVRSFTTKGDLAAAVAVQQEIAELKKADKEESGGTATSRRELEKEVIGHWSYGSEKVWLGIRHDGKAYLDKSVYLWKVGSENTIVMFDPAKPSVKATLEFDSKVDSFVGKDFDGKRVAGVRKDRE